MEALAQFIMIITFSLFAIDLKYLRVWITRLITRGRPAYRDVLAGLLFSLYSIYCQRRGRTLEIIHQSVRDAIHRHIRLCDSRVLSGLAHRRHQRPEFFLRFTLLWRRPRSSWLWSRSYLEWWCTMVGSSTYNVWQPHYEGSDASSHPPVCLHISCAQLAKQKNITKASQNSWNAHGASGYYSNTSCL